MGNQKLEIRKGLNGKVLSHSKFFIFLFLIFTPISQYKATAEILSFLFLSQKEYMPL
jgi:hypothetical protein